MTFEEIMHEVADLGNASQRVTLDIRGFINRAMQRVCQDRSWTGMRDRRQFQIQSGNTLVPLGPQFKELTPEQSPVSFSYGVYNIPVQVITRAELERYGIWPLWDGPINVPIPGGYYPIRVVFLERNGPGGQWTINIPPQFSVSPDCQFNVTAYYYPNPLNLGQDHNAITDHPQLCDAIINFAKSRLLFAEDPTSKAGVAAMKFYQEALTSAAYSDSATPWQGLTLRM